MGYRPQEARRQAPPHQRATFTGIVYRDGEKTEGETRSIEVDRRIGWSRKHDNRLVANEEDRERQDRVVQRDLQSSSARSPAST